MKYRDHYTPPDVRNFIRLSDRLMIMGTSSFPVNDLILSFEELVRVYGYKKGIRWANYVYPNIKASNERMLILNFTLSVRRVCPWVFVSRQLFKDTSVPISTWDTMLSRYTLRKEYIIGTREKFMRLYNKLIEVCNKFNQWVNKSSFNNWYRTDTTLISQRSGDMTDLLKQSKELSDAIISMHKDIMTSFTPLINSYGMDMSKRLHSVSTSTTNFDVMKMLDKVYLITAYDMHTPLEISGVCELYEMFTDNRQRRISAPGERSYGIISEKWKSTIVDVLEKLWFINEKAKLIKSRHQSHSFGSDPGGIYHSLVMSIKELYAKYHTIDPVKNKSLEHYYDIVNKRRLYNSLKHMKVVTKGNYINAYPCQYDIITDELRPVCKDSDKFDDSPDTDYIGYTKPASLPKISEKTGYIPEKIWVNPIGFNIIMSESPYTKENSVFIENALNLRHPCIIYLYMLRYDDYLSIYNRICGIRKVYIEWDESNGPRW